MILQLGKKILCTKRQDSFPAKDFVWYDIENCPPCIRGFPRLRTSTFAVSGTASEP